MKGEGYHCIEEKATNKRHSIQRFGDHLSAGRDAVCGGLHYQRWQLIR
jgi:hypothetical protein